jgi:hypothetical protein
LGIDLTPNVDDGYVPLHNEDDEEEEEGEEEEEEVLMPPEDDENSNPNSLFSLSSLYLETGCNSIKSEPASVSSSDIDIDNTVSLCVFGRYAPVFFL